MLDVRSRILPNDDVDARERHRAPVIQTCRFQVALGADGHPVADGAGRLAEGEHPWSELARYPELSRLVDDLLPQMVEAAKQIGKPPTEATLFLRKYHIPAEAPERSGYGLHDDPYTLSAMASLAATKVHAVLSVGDKEKRRILATGKGADVVVVDNEAVTHGVAFERLEPGKAERIMANLSLR